MARSSVVCDVIHPGATQCPIHAIFVQMMSFRTELNGNTALRPAVENANRNCCCSVQEKFFSG